MRMQNSDIMSEPRTLRQSGRPSASNPYTHSVKHRSCHFISPRAASSSSLCPPPSSRTVSLLGLTRDSSLTLGHSKCPADSFAVISQFVLPVTVGTFVRQVHVKKGQRRAGARQVKNDKLHVSLIRLSRMTRLAELKQQAKTQWHSA